MGFAGNNEHYSVRKWLIRTLLFVFVCAGALGAFSVTRQAHAASKKTKKAELDCTQCTLLAKDCLSLHMVNRKGRSVKWSSSNSKVAKVWRVSDDKCVVATLKPGTAVIKAKISSATLKCTVTVVKTIDENTQGIPAWRYTQFKDGVVYTAQGSRLGSVEETIKGKKAKLSGYKKQSILYIGASRTLNTMNAVKDSGVYFYYSAGGMRSMFYPHKKDGKSYQAALLVIDTFLSKKPSGTVIMDMGGIDPYNVDAYIGIYRYMNERYSKAKLWFYGVLPRKKGDPSNPQRKKFNKRIAAAFPGQSIDLYNYAYNNPLFRTKDGTHYYASLTRRLYQRTMDKIGRKVTVNFSSGKVTSPQAAEKTATVSSKDDDR